MESKHFMHFIRWHTLQILWSEPVNWARHEEQKGNVCRAIRRRWSSRWSLTKSVRR